jgi:glycosyltransferase involved in cell wall biosynthesis
LQSVSSKLDKEANMEYQKRKLLIVTDSYAPKKDGVTIFLDKIVPLLTREYDVTIAAPAFSIEAKPIGDSKLVLFPVSKIIKIADYQSAKLSRKNIKRLKELVKEADIIWTQDIALLGMLAINYGKKLKKPVLNYVHQIFWEQAVNLLSIPDFIKSILARLIRKIVKSIYNKCSLLLVPYSSLVIELKAKGITAEKTVVPLGVDYEIFRPAHDKGAAKHLIGIDPRARVIGYCGRISKEKNLAVLKKAFLRLKEDHKDIRLLIVGNGPEEEVEKLKDIPGVKITGFVEDVTPYLQAMDIFVMPSLTETTSLATLEAMSTALPVLSTKVGYIKDYIINKQNGLFFSQNNPYMLRKKLELLLNFPAKRHILGANARKTVQVKFSWNTTIGKMKRILKSF